MQAAVQTSQFFALQANTNVHSRSAMQSQPLRAGAYGARGPSPQMSNMMGGFSKSSFAMSSHSSANGSNSSFFAQATSVSRGHSASQPPARCDRHDDSYGGRDNATGGSRFDNSSQVKATGFNGKQGTLDTDKYNIAFNKSDSSIAITNKQTGTTNKVWGDPHYDNQGTFTGALDFKIPGGDFVVDSKPAKNNPNVSYADSATLSVGGQKWNVQHISQEDSAPLTVQKNGPAAAPHGYVLVPSRDGKGFVDPNTGKVPTQSDFNRNKA